VAAADEAITYGQFKRVASEAVRVADMRVVVSEGRRTRQSTLVQYLQLIGPIPEGSMFPNECRPYLGGLRVNSSISKVAKCMTCISPSVLFSELGAMI
jgi:hypothetical protein